jgi:hypothetical protein
MDENPSWEAISRSSTQEIPRLLWNLSFHNRVQKSPPLEPTLSNMKSSNPIVFKINLILSPHLYSHLQSLLFRSGFSVKILYAFLISPRPSHLSWSDHSNRLKNADYEASHHNCFQLPSVLLSALFLSSHAYLCPLHFNFVCCKDVICRI